MLRQVLTVVLYLLQLEHNIVDEALSLQWPVRQSELLLILRLSLKLEVNGELSAVDVLRLFVQE